MFLSAEMMLQGVALSLVGFGRYHGNWTGQVFTIVILTVAACEASVALALILILYKRRSSLDVSLWREIREPGHAVAPDDLAAEAEPVVAVGGPETYPHLIPAGLEPSHPRRPRRCAAREFRSATASLGSVSVSRFLIDNAWLVPFFPWPAA